MKKHKIFLSASMQENNVGVGSYGTEEANMFSLCDAIEIELNKYGCFEVFRNEPHWTLNASVLFEREVKPDITIDNHSNANNGKARGTEVYCYSGSQKGYELANCLYNEIAELTPADDRGLKSGNHLRIINGTNSPSVLIEHFFHDNVDDVEHYLNNFKKYVDAEVRGICCYFGVEYKENDNVVVEVPDDKYSPEIILELQEINQKLSEIIRRL